jgi:hypothetical protein
MRSRKIKDSELNSSKYFPNSNCPLFSSARILFAGSIVDGDLRSDFARHSKFRQARTCNLKRRFVAVV